MRTNLLISITVCLLCGGRWCGGLLAAADANPAFTSAAEAGPDFAFQGEYAGTADQQAWGVQVVALGGGKFDVVGYRGGLPGAGWQRGSETRRGTGELKDGVVRVQGDTWTATIQNSVFKVLHDGNPIGELKKSERRSPTLGAPPPPGAVVLFDGSSPDNFENGKLLEGNLLGATGCVSKRQLGDHSLHIEFRTPFMPLSRGQARGNSGVYVQGRYEVQVLDSFGLEGLDNECGGIYKMSQPAVNACLPPLAWQTYDIDFTAAKYDAAGKKTDNARVTIKHNGIVIHDRLELKGGTPGYKPEGPGRLGLFLQNHGNPVAFRNIWVVE
jgi:Domain of Unknown Function (DUF1080)